LKSHEFTASIWRACVSLRTASGKSVINSNPWSVRSLSRSNSVLDAKS
jgi:hypothetical protein